MAQQGIDILDGFWDRIDEEIHKQNISKLQIAKRCRFNRKTLYKPKENNRYMRIVYFARLCAELNVSADYLLFGEAGGGKIRMSMPCYLRVRGLHERINDEIKKQNKTKIKIAENCGFERKTIESEDYNLSLPNFAKLCKELNVSADYLLFGKEHKGE